MADDIVTRLRDQAQAPALAWLTAAADEILRLRAENKTLVKAIEAYRSIRAWDEARHAQETRLG